MYTRLVSLQLVQIHLLEVLLALISTHAQVLTNTKFIWGLGTMEGKKCANQIRELFNTDFLCENKELFLKQYEYSDLLRHQFSSYYSFMFLKVNQSGTEKSQMHHFEKEPAAKEPVY